MPLDTSIDNVGEYYSEHYLATTFLKDIKDLRAGWRERAASAPPRRVQALSRHYFAAKTEVLEETRPERRWDAGPYQRGWHSHLLEALGYEGLQPADFPVEGGSTVAPVLHQVHRYGQPWLVIAECPFLWPEGSLQPGMPSESPLDLAPLPVQFKDKALHPSKGPWSRVLGRILTVEAAPRWIIFLAGSEILLLDRHTYAQGRWLRFDLDDAYGRNENDTFVHLAAFLSAETLCPGAETAQVLHDTLEAQSHKFAHGVTENLQKAVRESIQDLVNAWVADRRRQNLSYTRLRTHEIPENGNAEVTAELLKHEALVFIYRLIFCFYAESRGGELDILPISDEIYRLGYSLESLRDLEQIPLTAATEEGAYFHEHLQRLFALIHEGFDPEGRKATPQPGAAPEAPAEAAQTHLVFAGGTVQYHAEAAQQHLDFRQAPQTLSYGGDDLDMAGERASAHAFMVRPLTATLFAPESTPLFNRARFPNRILQQVIKRLSLSKDERNKSIGRVNYAELGVNQLGAVYEGLLSYRGLFADRDLIHVKPDDPKKPFSDPKTPTWFVPKERVDEFRKDEVERTEDGRPRIYPMGDFVLHLSGVDRQQSASYYTPEVLTRCLVEEALRELLKDYTPADADKILALTLCEPAMGSGAFLNEAAGQLAAHYLDLKQRQLGKSIDPARYQDELRRTKHYIVTRNVYGVDLNATAVELGALSLWLGSIHRVLVAEGRNGNPDRTTPCATPWTGLRLRCGNSLIGARRAVWTREQLMKGKHQGKSSTAPRLLKPGELRAENEIYHFLVFDEEMVPAAGDKRMKAFHPEACARAAAWQKSEVKRGWGAEEVTEALHVCRLIDTHGARYAERRARALEECATPASVWPEAPSPGTTGPTLARQEAIRRDLEAGSGSFQRLKLLQDTWCALWFWPLKETECLPTREAFLALAGLLLDDHWPEDGAAEFLSARVGFDVAILRRATRENVPDAAILADTVPWCGVATACAAEQHFHHWELVFPEVLGAQATHKGFDLIVGNPPWIKVGWADDAILADFEPRLGVREAKSADYGEAREALLEDEGNRARYTAGYEAAEGSATYLNSRRFYEELVGSQTNLYKNFIVRSWGILSESGMTGLLHPEGNYDDAKGGVMRTAVYARLAAHYQLVNEEKLFKDVHNETTFSINLYHGNPKAVHFRHMANLYTPRTIAESLTHDRPFDPVPGIKTAEGNWETRPHAHRVVTITEEELAIFARLLEDADTSPSEARLPQIHAQEILEVIEKFAAAPRRLMDLRGDYYPTEMFHESNSQRDGIITRTENPSIQPENPENWVLSGPHFYVGTPFNKSPYTHVKSNKAYDDIDLTSIPEDYLPRAVYRPGNKQGDRTAFYKAIKEWPEPSVLGFQPVDPADADHWAVLLGEPLRVHGMDPSRPGAKTARSFGFFTAYSDAVDQALAWLRKHPKETSLARVRQESGNFTVRQGVPSEEERKRLPVPITARYRFGNRKMLSLSTERSYIGTIFPPGTTHMDGVFSLTFRDPFQLVQFAASASSILLDFYMRATGKANCRHDVARTLPLLEFPLRTATFGRTLRLSCLTRAYADLWTEVADASIRAESWTVDDPRLAHEFEHAWGDLDPGVWNWKTPLRSDFARRQALVEIDVLVAMSLKLTLAELQTIYRVQFPVLRQYEAVDEYDARGRRLPNTARKDAGGKELRELRTKGDWDGESPLTVSWPVDNGNSTVTKTFHPPFTGVDRERDYERAWSAFEERLKDKV